MRRPRSVTKAWGASGVGIGKEPNSERCRSISSLDPVSAPRMGVATCTDVGVLESWTMAMGRLKPQP